MNQITAEDAFNLAKQNNTQSEFLLTKRLIKVINKKIKQSCFAGKFYISLNSIDNDGNNINGLFIYLSPEIIEKIEKYYNKLGFKIMTRKNNITYINTLYLCWEETKLTCQK